METHLSKLLAIQRQVNDLVKELTTEPSTEGKKGRGRPAMTKEEREKAKAIRDAEKAAKKISDAEAASKAAEATEAVSEEKPKRRIIKLPRGKPL
jgi:hypothetical protein